MTDKARILFVDDEKRVLNSMRGLFRREYELFLATEGAEAVRIATENDIDVIVADQRMPGMTGVEVLAKIKEQSPRTVRVLLTGYADPSAVEGSINIGEVFRFLSKPCPPKMLRETLSLAISASRTSPVETANVPPSTAQPAANSVPQHDIEAIPRPAPRPAPVVAPRSEPPVHELPSLDPIHDDDETQPAMRALDESAMQAMSEPAASHWQSVTNVVMSEDTVETTQENVVLTSSTLSTNDVGVVIFTVDSEFAATAIRAASADRNTILATTLVKVAQAIQQQNAGVLVTDFTTNNSILKKIVAALKQRMPHLVTIVVSSGRDTTDMINLINFGQVFRYVMKPVEPEQLRSDINAAVIRHLYLLNNPESVKRHQVIDTPIEATGASTTVNRFLGSIQNLPPSGTDPADTLT
ncbi:MAG: response regulator [Gammaproteobacteria bacterium]|nr:response regulator [Gammaproteobacteria bacterium]MDH3431499.1 response regulator [Gammaproteobacteria bacterium]MDH3435177.1 response regulator [Gammaproteobacteria bacterium]